MIIKLIIIHCTTQATSTDGKSSVPTKKGVLDLETRKKTALISLLETVFQQLESTFNLAHSVQEVVVLLGSTIVTPKETYTIRFPTAMYEGKLLSLQQAKFCLFRKLVTNPCWTEVPEMKATKMYIFVFATRDDGLSRLGLKPQLAFKKPTKGRIFNINLHCKCTEVSPELSRLGDAEFEISGVEPFDTSDIMENDTNGQLSAAACNGDYDRTESDSHYAQDFIWYQLPVVVHGLKTKSK